MPLGPMWLNRWLIPCLISVFYLLVYFYPPLRNLFFRLVGWFEEKISGIKRTERKLFLRDPKFLKGVRLEANRYWITIAVTSSILLILLFDYVSGWSLGGIEGEALWFSSLTSGFLNPISEELLVRGIFLNVIIFTFVQDFGWKGEKRYGIYAAGLILSSFIFALPHANKTLFQWSVRFAFSSLIGLVFILSDRNLLPPIVAHGVWNWYLIAKAAVF